MFPETKIPIKTVKAWCCNVEADYELKTFSNGTKHAVGKCKVCGKTNAKRQNIPTDGAKQLEEIHHRLLWIRSLVISMKPGEDQDEAVAMVERMADQLGYEI